jgi:hypothetical protein
MLKSRKFWAYEPCQAFEIKQEIFDNYKIKGKLHDDVQYFYDLIGIAPHPCFKLKQSKADPANPPVELSSLEVINSKIDINTLKIIFFLLPYTKIYNMKFISNDWDINNLEYLINSILEKTNNIYYLSFEWNDKLNINGTPVSINSELANTEYVDLFTREKQLLCKLIQNSKLEGVCLRGDFIGDETAIQIFGILEKNTTIKSLSLYYNNLTPKCFPAFCQMLLYNRKLEDINFGKNNFNDECIEKLKENIGKFPMSQEEVVEYNKKVKERDAIIKANIKLKQQKKPENEVPFLFEMIMIEDQNYLVKNKDLKNINFMLNPLTDKCYDSLIHIFDNCPDMFITIDNKVLTDEHKKNFLEKNSKYYEKMYFSK